MSTQLRIAWAALALIAAAVLPLRVHELIAAHNTAPDAHAPMSGQEP